ncbi:MAG: ABC transporter ATP-binding protein [Gammaproteobacteria bacterium]|nr:ABC transporter ATP-binding protein [Gammaproteobacteria bacterium]MCP5459307.1 ABC transporter ATP-binding protein [Gammaproteobacteria bacterium]
MARIDLQKIAHAYRPHPSKPADYALKPMDHVWEDGGAYALLGPSGCGKSTLLNVISGLLRPSEGRVLFDRRDVTDLPTKERNIAQVFQFPVIYDTMTVFENLAFPLRNRGFGREQVSARVNEVAEMLELTPVLHKRAQNLTADAKQTISLGRGLVRSDVTAILFDEPLTVIDPHLKWLLRRKLKQIHEQYKLTLVYVTHDQNEALTFADKVVVMNDGEVLQLGTPQELFERPAHTFIGHFIGSPGMNFLACELDGAHAVTSGERIALLPGLAERARQRGGRMEIGVRPEFLRLRNEAGDGTLAVKIASVRDLGNFKIVGVRLGEHLLNVKVAEDQDLPAEQAHLGFTAEMTRLYANGVLVG